MSNQDWATVATYNWISEAEVVKGALESAGIDAFIPEEHTSTINPIITGVQVRVQVRESTLEEARALLNAKISQPKEICPKCGTDRVKLVPIGFKGWVQFMFCSLLMIPMRRNSQKICANCGAKI